ncbi:MAG: hypothetical protein QNJ58_20125 [Desulfobacterales bacterium]|nr:hypothetical protein [Desulfobacterales bacterium]
MFNCKSVSEKVSLAMDQTLPFRERLMITMHMWMCKYCRRFKDQMLTMRKALRLEESYEEKAGLSLSLPSRIREQIKKDLTDALNTPIRS